MFLAPSLNFEVRTLNFAALVFAVSVAAGVAAAQEAGVELRLESTTLEVGEVVDGQLVCTNTGQPQPPVILAPDGLEVQIANPIPAQFSQMSNINGRVSQKTTYTFSLRVTGKKEGVHAIGPFAVVADGTTFQTAPVRVTVQRAAAALQAEGDRLVFARISVEPRSLYVTQSFTATLVIGIRKVEIDGQIVELDNLLEFVDGGGSDISIFPTRFSSSLVSMDDSAGQRHPYVLHRASKEIRAEEVGPFSVGPVFLKVNYPIAFRRGFFQRLEVAKARKETARAEAIIVDVKGPPEQGRPADFTGAIGHYSLNVDAKPTQVEQGRPITLQLTIGGEPLEGLASPALSQQAELLSRFDFASDELTGDVEGKAKVFRRAIFPKQPGEQSIPPISWSFFDPKAETYKTLFSKPVPIVVDPPAPGSVPLPSAADIARAEANGQALTVLTGGIAPNYVDPALVLADQSLSISTGGVTAAFVLPPLTWAVISLGARHRRRVLTDAGYARQRRAKRRAHGLIEHALRKVGPAEQLCGLAHALTGFVSDRFDLPPGERTPHEMRMMLAERGLNSKFADEVAAFLETCDAARYAPGVLDPLSPQHAAGKVREWIIRIDRGAP